MRINYCDGYFREDNNFFRHDYESGMDFIVSEDEAMAHKPSMLLDGDDNWNNSPWYAHNHEDNPKGCLDEDVSDVLREKYNQYKDYLDVLEELLEEAKVDGNTLAAITFAEDINTFRNAQSVIMKRLGIIF